MRNIVLLAALLASPGVASAGTFSLNTSGSYSTGRYGGLARTQVSAISVSASKAVGHWELSASLPYVRVSAGGDELTVGTIVVKRNGEGGRLSGYGDALLSAGGPLPLEMVPVDVSVQAQLKVPTGSRSLSSGKFDAGLDLELSKSFGAAAPFAMLGYRVYGDSDELDFKNGWAASAGTTLTVSSVTFIASYDWSQSPVGLPASHEIFAVATGPLAQNWKWSLYASKGLSNGAADRMIGMGLTRSIGRLSLPR